MPEHDVHELFDHFRSGGPLMIPAGPGAARSVSQRRRRARLGVAVAAAAVVVVTSAVAYAVSPPPGTRDILDGTTPTPPTTSAATSAPPTTPAATPTPPTTSAAPEVEPKDVPAAAMLQVSDLPRGTRYLGDNLDGDWSWNANSYSCRSFVSVSTSSVRRGAVFGGGPVSLIQLVERFSVVDAKAYLNAVRQTVARCTDDPRQVFTIVYKGFAGDDSLVVEVNNEGIHNVYIFVRVGGLVSQVWYKDTTEPDPVHIGERVAQRLCQGTIAC